MRNLGGRVNEDYVTFCEKFIKCVVGAKTYGEGWKKRQKVCEMSSPSDEAMALLLLENSEARWSTEFELLKTTTKVQDSLLPKAKYTGSGKNKKLPGITKRYGGWNNDGIERFNELFKLVKEDRKRNGKWFDDLVADRLPDSDDASDVLVDSPLFAKAHNDLFDESSDEQQTVGEQAHKEHEDEEHEDDAMDDLDQKRAAV